jgi:hypothetical protein
MQFDCFSRSSSPDLLEPKILHLTQEQTYALKNGITSFTLNLFAVPEGFNDLERRELVQTSEISLVNCARNLLPVLNKFLTIKLRLDSKFRLNDGILFTDGLEIEIDIKPIFNELYRIINYILKTLIEHYQNEIRYYTETKNYITDNPRFSAFEIAAISIRLEGYIEEYKAKFAELILTYLVLINFNIDYIVHNITNNPDFFMDENIIKIIFSLCKIRDTDISIFTPNLSRLINIVFTTSSIVLHLKLDALYLISAIEIFNQAFYQQAIKKPVEISYYVDLAVATYLKFVENKSLTELFRDILYLNQMISRFLSFQSMADTRVEFSENLVNYIYAMLDLYFEVNKIPSSDLERIQVRLLEQIYTLLDMCPILIETDLVKFIPYTFINAINNDEFAAQHTSLVEKISCLLSQNPKYKLYVANSCTSIDRYASILVCYEDIARYMTTLQKITEAVNNDFIDDLSSEFIITIGLLPLANGELKICDKFFILSSLRNKSVNPFTREALTVEDFLQIQLDNKARIDELEKQRKAFVTEVKRR